MKKTYKLILWDLDNTLFDFDKAEESALQYAMEKHGLHFDPETTLEEFRIINTARWRGLEEKRYTKEEVLVGRFEEFFGDRFSESRALNEDYLSCLGELKDLYPDAERVVKTLDDWGYIQSIVTNGDKSVQDACFYRSAIAPYIKAIVVSEAVGVTKPDPRIFEIACEESGWTEKESTLVIGDSLSSDIAGGKAYGVDTCFFNRDGRSHKASPTYELEHLNEVLTLLQP